MVYVAAAAESIPLPDGYFDAICSFNSLDHVDDLDGAIGEVKRVVRIGGLVLLLSDVHEEPTPQEPNCFGWDVVDLFGPELAPQAITCLREVGGRDVPERGAGGSSTTRTPSFVTASSPPVL